MDGSILALVLGLVAMGLFAVAIVAIVALTRRDNASGSCCQHLVVHPGGHHHEVGPHHHDEVAAHHHELPSHEHETVPAHDHPLPPIQTDETEVTRIVDRVLRNRLPVVPPHVHNNLVTEHVHRHVGRPFSRLAAIIAGVITGVVLAVVLGLLRNSVVTLILQKTHTNVTLDQQLTHNVWLKIVIWVFIVSGMTYYWGRLIPGFRDGNRHQEDQ